MVNVILLVTLVDPLGIAGAGIALCGAYVVIVFVLYMLTRDLFSVPFEWPRLALGGPRPHRRSASPASCSFPTHGALGLATRFALLCLAPPALVLARVITIPELRRLQELRHQPA